MKKYILTLLCFALLCLPLFAKDSVKTPDSKKPAAKGNTAAAPAVKEFDVTPADNPQNAPEVDLKDFSLSFTSDSDKTYDRYVYTYITVKGIVTEAAVSRYATPAVSISDKENGEVYVVCVLPRADFPKLSSFKKGDEVKVTGMVYGRKERLVIKQCARAN